MGLRNKRTGTAAKDGTAQASASKQGKRQRAKPKEDVAPAPAAPVWPDAGDGTSPQIGRFATIHGGHEHEDEDGAKHTLDGLYGVVNGIHFSPEDGLPVSATLGIRSPATPGVYRPPTGDGNIEVPWAHLRRSVGGP